LREKRAKHNDGGRKKRKKSEGKTSPGKKSANRMIRAVKRNRGVVKRNPIEIMAGGPRGEKEGRDRRAEGNAEWHDNVKHVPCATKNQWTTKKHCARNDTIAVKEQVNPKKRERKKEGGESSATLIEK